MLERLAGFVPELASWENPSDVSFGDLDGDGDPDLLSGSPVKWLPNEGSPTSPSFGTPVPGPFGLSDSPPIRAHRLVDLDGDGDLDLFGDGGGVQDFLYWENTGTATRPRFKKAVDAPFGHPDSSISTFQGAFVDLDGDGDLDFLIGQRLGIWYYENIGTATSPSYGGGVQEPFGLGDLDVNGLDAADVDGDGDFDVLGISPGLDGLVVYLQNIGTASSPSFAPPASLPGLIPVGLLSGGIVLEDLDGDGDPDVVLPQANGSLHVHRNVGTATSPSFEPPAHINAFGIESRQPSRIVESDPVPGDLDADGDVDLIVIEGFHVAPHYYENTGTAEQPQFALQPSGFGGLTPVGGHGALEDLDADGDLDLIVGYREDIRYFPNNGDPTTPAFGPEQLNPFSIESFDIGEPSNRTVPHLEDFDGDGDPDLLVAPEHSVAYYENIGTPYAPRFAPPDDSFAGLLDLGYLHPATADVDGDGDRDLIAGDFRNYRYYENVGGVYAPGFAFQPGSEPLPRFLQSTESNPAFADLNGDARPDLIVGDCYTFALYFFLSDPSCQVDADCDDTSFCTGVETCIAGQCVAATSPCTDPAAPWCDEAQDVCVGCLSDSTCSDDLYCTGVEACIGGVCQPSSGDPCAAAGLSCREGSDSCFTCSFDAQCDDGLDCNGAETCSGGLCVPGTPLCSGTTPVCDESQGTCSCGNDDDCSDGLFCTGEELCEAGVCTASPGDPCVGTAEFRCNETADECAVCFLDSHCDNTVFCDGVESCTDGLCVPGSPPCEFEYLCEDRYGYCVECFIDDQCDDGLVCNGVETCVQGLCESGVDPCAGGPEPFCDEAAGGVCVSSSVELLSSSREVSYSGGLEEPGAIADMRSSSALGGFHEELSEVLSGSDAETAAAASQDSAVDLVPDRLDILVSGDVSARSVTLAEGTIADALARSRLALSFRTDEVTTLTVDIAISSDLGPFFDGPGGEVTSSHSARFLLCESGGGCLADLLVEDVSDDLQAVAGGLQDSLQLPPGTYDVELLAVSQVLSNDEGSVIGSADFSGSISVVPEPGRTLGILATVAALALCESCRRRAGGRTRG